MLITHIWFRYIYYFLDK